MIQLSPEEERIRDESVLFIKQNQQRLIETFIIRKKPVPIGYATMFMAGSPGAGKTEFSRRLPIRLKDFSGIDRILRSSGFDPDLYESLFIRIDVDEIREFIPQYIKTDVVAGTVGNAHVVNKAATTGLDILRKYCLKNKVAFLHDGTFSNYSTMRDIIKKSLKVGRDVQIYYIYIDPITAWKFTQAREYLEGRNILKENFVNQFFLSQENVSLAKHEFGDNVKIHCILKNSENNLEKIEFNITYIDKFLEEQHNSGLLKKYSRDELINMLARL